MIYQNYKSDFLMVEKFYRDKDRSEQMPVPEHVVLSYFTARRENSFRAERNGAYCSACQVSEDGMDLLVYLPLSRCPVGRGELLKVVTEVVDDDNYPSGVKLSRVPQKTGVFLYDGVSDSDGAVISESVLSLVLYGYSAYELAVKHGFEGTEEEWIASCSPDLSGIESSIAELMDEVFPLSFATFTGGGSQERGTEVTPSISWSLTRKGAAVDPTAATVNGSTEGVSPDMKSYAAPAPISEDANYAVKVSAGSQSLTRTASYRFLYRKWWGVSDKESLTSEDVLGLSGSQLATGRGLSATAFDCTGGKWPYYVLPAELAGGLECWIGGLRNSDLVTADLEVVNAHGVSHGYKVIRLNERQTGILTIEFR